MDSNSASCNPTNTDFCSVIKDQVTAEVNVLLDLKAQYKTLTGKDFKPANSGGKKDKKEKAKNPQGGNKQEKKSDKKAEKKEEVKGNQDERAVKKITRFVLHFARSNPIDRSISLNIYNHITIMNTMQCLV